MAVNFGGSRLRAAVCWNHNTPRDLLWIYAAAFGRLCVETVGISSKHFGYGGSRLRAAVCWNSFECELSDIDVVGSRLRAAVCWNNNRRKFAFDCFWQPPSGGCVLKPCLVFLREKIPCSRLRAAVCWNKSLVRITISDLAAAFGRLCVETWRKENFSHLNRLRL